MISRYIKRFNGLNYLSPKYSNTENYFLNELYFQQNKCNKKSKIFNNSLFGQKYLQFKNSSNFLEFHSYEILSVAPSLLNSKDQLKNIYNNEKNLDYGNFLNNQQIKIIQDLKNDIQKLEHFSYLDKNRIFTNNEDICFKNKIFYAKNIQNNINKFILLYEKNNSISMKIIFGSVLLLNIIYIIYLE